MRRTPTGRRRAPSFPRSPATPLRCPVLAIWPEKAEALSDLLAARHGYLGDTDTYDDLANANLIRVIERRRGLPVALGVIWLHAARAAGWEAHGVDFPAHFMIALQGKSTQIVLDVFHGGVAMGARDLRPLLKRIEGENAELRPGLLLPMNARQVLLRLQNNIAGRRMQAGDLDGALACIEDMLRVAPDQAELWRQAAMLNQQLDRVSAALRCFERCLQAGAAWRRGDAHPLGDGRAARPAELAFSPCAETPSQTCHVIARGAAPKQPCLTQLTSARQAGDCFGAARLAMTGLSR